MKVVKRGEFNCLTKEKIFGDNNLLLTITYYCNINSIIIIIIIIITINI